MLHLVRGRLGVGVRDGANLTLTLTLNLVSTGVLHLPAQRVPLEYVDDAKEVDLDRVRVRDRVGVGVGVGVMVRVRVRVRVRVKIS